MQTTQDLLDKQSAIEANPKNRMPSGSIFLYTPAARKKLDAITREITYQIALRRATAGRPVALRRLFWQADQSQVKKVKKDVDG